MSSVSVPGPVPAPLVQDASWEYIHASERVAAAVLLILLSPLLLVIGICILALSGKSPLIAHRRVGQYGSELWLIKFRTMWKERDQWSVIRPALAVERIDDEAGPKLKGPEDRRVASRFARFCRRHSLDELPQLVHVLLGEMSLVGPRPVTRAELTCIYGSDVDEILRAKPGLAGLWQVSGRNRLTLQERRRLDLQCARRTLRLHFWILLKTVPEVLNGANTW